MSWLLLLSLASAQESADNGPAIDVAGGLALFSPLNRPFALNPGVD